MGNFFQNYTLISLVNKNEFVLNSHNIILIKRNLES